MGHSNMGSCSRWRNLPTKQARQITRVFKKIVHQENYSGGDVTSRLYPSRMMLYATGPTHKTLKPAKWSVSSRIRVAAGQTYSSRTCRTYSVLTRRHSMCSNIHNSNFLCLRCSQTGRSSKGLGVPWAFSELSIPTESGQLDETACVMTKLELTCARSL